MTAEIERDKKPVTVQLTTPMVTLMGSIFVVMLTATVFVIRLSDKLQEMSTTMDNVNARVERTLAQSADNNNEISRLRAQFIERERIDSIKELLKRH